MTLQKLANLCGCSVATVSKALKNSPEISEKTKAKIFEIAKQHGCYNKYFSPKLQKKVFAVICPEIISPHYSAVIEALNKRITEKGDILLISISKFSSNNLENIVDYYINFHNVDGIILAFTAIPKDILQKKDISLVVLGENNYLPFYDCVNVDFNAGISEVVSYFKKMGHEKIGYIGEYLTAPALTVLKENLKNNKLEINDEWMITNNKRNYEAGYTGMDMLISKPTRPTAVYCAYDAIAFGAIKRAFDAHLKLPEDFSIISRDNSPVGEYFEPSLTSISLPIDELAETTINLLYSRIAAPYKAYQNVFIQSKLVIRNSVKDLKNKKG